MADSGVNSDRIKNIEPQQNDIYSSTRYYTGIDWASLFFRLLENIHWILLAAILCAVGTGLYIRAFVTPIYQATSKMYIAGSETTISLSDIQLGSSLAMDYQEAFKIWHVHEMVDQRLGLDYSYSKLSDMVSVSSPSGSHLLYIDVRSPDPEEAKLLADTYAEVVQDFIAEKMELRRPQVLEIAQLPSRPVSPNIKASVIKAFIFGALAAAAVVVFLYLLDDKIRSADDIEKATGLATLGMLTNQEKNTRELTSAGVSEEADGANIAEIRRSLSLDYAGDESINTICSAIVFAGKNMKRVAITSHEPNNGKTFLSIRIAHSMAERGKKVLLIDGDLRKAAMTNQYRITNVTNGLAHLLSGQCTLKEAVYTTNYPNLYLLPAGEVVKTPLPLLTSPEFEQLMDHAASHFDLVVVDTPPIGIVIDAAEIAKRCDGSILVIEYNKQTKGSLRYMQKIMEQTQTPVIGCVINNVIVKRLNPRNYYYYQYSGGYQYYDAEGSSKAEHHKKRNLRSGRRKK